MPNGGVPLHMVIRPAISSAHVVYCKGAELIVTTDAALQAGNADGSAVLQLNHDEALVLERFLRYWLRDREERVLYGSPNVNVAFDF